MIYIQFKTGVSIMAYIDPGHILQMYLKVMEPWTAGCQIVALNYQVLSFTFYFKFFVHCGFEPPDRRSAKSSQSRDVRRQWRLRIYLEAKVIRKYIFLSFHDMDQISYALLDYHLNQLGS